MLEPGTINELRQHLLRSMEFAQEQSRAPNRHQDRLSWKTEMRALSCERDRLRTFMAFLSGRVIEDDAELGAAISTFLETPPRAPLPGQAPSTRISPIHDRASDARFRPRP